VDAPDILIEGCHFRDLFTAAIEANWTRAVIRNNRIFVGAGTIGIDIRQSGANRPDNMVYGNWILGSNSTDTGIKISATEPTDGTLLVALNVVTNCATNITQDKSDAGVVVNWTYGDSAAPVQVDPNA